MDLRQLRVPDIIALNRATGGKLQDALAAAWETCDATDIDIQVTFERGIYRIHILGLVGDAVVFEQSIHVRGDRTLGEAHRIVLLLLWIDTLQSRTARALARGDAGVMVWSASRP